MMMEGLVPSGAAAASIGFTSGTVTDDSPFLLSDDDYLTPEEQEQEAQVPHCSIRSACKRCWIFCCVTWRAPILLIIVNLMALGVAHAMTGRIGMTILFRNSRDMYERFEQDEDAEALDEARKVYTQQMQIMVASGMVLLSIIWGSNTWFFLKRARQLEQQVLEQNHHEEEDELHLTQTTSSSESMESTGEFRPSGRVATNDRTTGIGNTTINAKDDEHKVDPVQMSKKIDASFGLHNDAPNATFLVALLYAIFAIAAYNAVATTVQLLNFQITVWQSHGNTTQFERSAQCVMGSALVRIDDWAAQENDEGIASLVKNETAFAKVPLDVQEWIKSFHQGRGDEMIWRRDHYEFDRSVPYILLPDQSLVFPIVKTIPPDANQSNSPFGGMGRSEPVSGIAIQHWNSSTSQSNVIEYLATKMKGRMWGDRDSKTNLVGFPKAPPYTAWCAEFDYGFSKFLQSEVICYNSKEHGNGNHEDGHDDATEAPHVHRFPPVKDDKQSWGGSSDHQLFATDEALWIASKKAVDRDMYNDNIFGNNNQDQTREVILSLVSYDTYAMTKTVAIERNVSSTRKQDHVRQHQRIVNPRCKTGYHIRLAISILSLAAGAYYLYRLDVPSCVLPACVALAMTINGFFPQSRWIASVVMLLFFVAALFVLSAKKDRPTANIWKYVSKEMMTWALYCTLMASCWGYLSQLSNLDLYIDFRFYDGWKDFLLGPLVIMAAAVVITVLLDHPIFSILAYTIALVGALSMVALLEGIRFLIGPMILFLLSLGCFGAGRLVQEYRVHIIVYSRRLGRCIYSLTFGQCCGARRRPTSPGGGFL